jgi:hypothetical protein
MKKFFLNIKILFVKRRLFYEINKLLLYSECPLETDDKILLNNFNNKNEYLVSVQKFRYCYILTTSKNKQIANRRYYIGENELYNIFNSLSILDLQYIKNKLCTYSNHNQKN